MLKVVPSDFQHTALGREIAFENHKSATWLEGIVCRTNHFLIWCFDRGLRLFSYGLAGNGKRIGMQETHREQPLSDQRSASCFEQISSNEPATRLEVCNKGNA